MNRSFYYFLVMFFFILVFFTFLDNLFWCGYAVLLLVLLLENWLWSFIFISTHFSGLTNCTDATQRPRKSLQKNAEKLLWGKKTWAWLSTPHVRADKCQFFSLGSTLRLCLKNTESTWFWSKFPFNFHFDTLFK